MANLDNRSDQNIGAALQRVTDNLTGLVHDEIALAKAEVSEKVSKLLKGAVVAVIAGVFFFFGLFVLLEGFAWLAYYAIPFPKGTIFFGFFVVAAIVFVVGGCAGFFAARAFKAGAPPTPDTAIAEAKATKSAVSEAWQGGQEKFSSDHDHQTASFVGTSAEVKNEANTNQTASEQEQSSVENLPKQEEVEQNGLDQNNDHNQESSK